MNILEYAKLKKLLGKGGGATAFTVSSIDELPTDAVDGSTAIVESDSIKGKWEWKDYQGQLDCSMLNLFSLGSNFEIKVRANGYDMCASNFFTAFSFEFDYDFKIQLIDPYYNKILLYIDENFDDGYQQFEFYDDASDIIAHNLNGKDEVPFTIDDFKTFIKTNCNRLSGGYSLYIRENGEWVYKCEVA